MRMYSLRFVQGTIFTFGTAYVLIIKYLKKNVDRRLYKVLSTIFYNDKGMKL